mmetsp:Transcript_2926/g.8460  ORF Transcript_2926/g.8460 Transcript_2926/m.8460 type:complete len:210 (+) Transcript_2926:91-720(+)
MLLSVGDGVHEGRAGASERSSCSDVTLVAAVVLDPLRANPLLVPLDARNPALDSDVRMLALDALCAPGGLGSFPGDAGARFRFASFFRSMFAFLRFSCPRASLESRPRAETHSTWSCSSWKTAAPAVATPPSLAASSSAAAGDSAGASGSALTATRRSTSSAASRFGTCLAATAMALSSMACMLAAMAWTVWVETQAREISRMLVFVSA